jgi:imidazoleglycerol-phosphate dehydratase
MTDEQQIETETVGSPVDARRRRARVARATEETDVSVTLTLEGAGDHEIATGVGFLDHLLAHVAVHGLFDLEVQADGDLHVDPHHTAEDVALVLGQAFDQALGDRAGLVRVGAAYVPMDESLAFVAVDLSGRPYAVTDLAWSGTRVGGLPVTLIPHVMESFSITARANVHARVLYGRDDHHKAEALFKALGRALDQATRRDPRRAEAIPSTKGTL